MAAKAKESYPHRESKKPKKGAVKTKSVGSILAAPVTVEVIKKKRPPKETADEGTEE
ncbi:MAG: hypothetical protein WC749_16750 [Dehalococcoidia bacterium]